MACDVWCLYMDYDEVLVFCPVDDCFRLRFVVCLYAYSCSSAIKYVDARGTGDYLDDSGSTDAGAAKIVHIFEAWWRRTGPCASGQDNVGGYLSLVSSLLI